MINTNTYVSTLFTIILAAITMNYKENKIKKSILFVLLILALTIIYIYDADISHREYVFSKFIFLPFSNQAFTELPNNEMKSIIVFSLLINLLSYCFLKFKMKTDENFLDIKFKKKYIIITIIISFFISSYLHILLFDLLMHKIFILINNENLPYFLYGVLLYLIALFEAWLLLNLNLYLSFRASKSK